MLEAVMLRRLFLILWFFGCGGVVSGVTDAGDGGADGALPLDAAADAGWTACTSPDGFAVCDGPNQCPASLCGSAGVCPYPGTVSDSVPRACGSALEVSESPCESAPDGLICFQSDPRPESNGFFWATAFNVGVLLAQNGGSNFVRYADFGLWTGDPIPEPTTCPKLQNAIICGGNCGTCSYNAVCHGRSPLHPWSFCLPTDIQDGCNLAKGVLCQDPANKCFAFKVEDAGQALANANSMCLPKDMCDDLAANLPGGGICE